MYTHIMEYLEDVPPKVNCDFELFVLFYLKITFKKCIVIFTYKFLRNVKIKKNVYTKLVRAEAKLQPRYPIWPISSA